MMAKKNLIDCGLITRTPDKYPKNNLKKTPSPRVRSPEIRTSPRQSPGLVAGHYAGCKWSEPPSPSTLPTPPQHWMQHQQIQQSPIVVPSLTTIQQYHYHHEKPNIAQIDLASQLKVLLKVQA